MERMIRVPNEKPSKAFMSRYITYVLTRMTFRDTALLEDYHAVHRQLDMDFHSKMLVAVQANYEKLFPQIKTVILSSDPRSISGGLLYDGLYALLRSVQEWLPPRKIRDRFTGSIAEFVLGGEFTTACFEQCKLTDEEIMKLNIDVYNRFYTLVCRNIIENFLY